ncbi:hypothetical protein A1O3_00915 [Capronia epimyces CBS 606.96]|uniref:Uncharacterized protein n=1 Tax=Capronia epimyces CBS 606.96 TaxID=1182542 RepID=W9YRV7_9EURO|nr:uncharacterized protein A1O3_00915 [Capronia epimyces CBS 606.96]EXJ92365.1 hypothetical protein A1O3_00915 [Capronia epimyces CBS 606.96]
MSTLAEIAEMLAGMSRTDLTTTVRREPYPAISPSRPELSQAGRVVLVTGGGTGVGFAIARAFVRASAKTIIILGRRAQVLADAASRLEEEAKTVGSGTKIVTYPCDVVNTAEVDAVWKEIAAQGITVDVYVANVAKTTEPKPMLELGTDEVWSQVETNVKAPLYLAEKFYAQPGESRKFIINVSTASIHSTTHPGVAERPAYTLSKLSGTLLFQLLAQDAPREKVQVVSFHPGLIWNDGWKSLGLSPDLFDSDELCGAFAVWLASENASFLHGRFVWASWDVDELSSGELRKRFDEDPNWLRASIVGLNQGLRTY